MAGSNVRAEGRQFLEPATPQNIYSPEHLFFKKATEGCLPLKQESKPKKTSSWEAANRPKRIKGNPQGDGGKGTEARHVEGIVVVRHVFVPSF